MGVPRTYTFYPIDQGAEGGTNMDTSFDVPGTSTTGTGWNMSKTAANNYAEMIYGTENSTWTGTPQPTNPLSGADAMVSPNFDGAFNAGNWLVRMHLTAVTLESGQQGRIRFRVWKGPDVSGAGASLVSATVFDGSIITSLASPGGTSVATASLPSFRVDDEHVFFEMAWQITTAAGKNNCDADFVVGSDSFITTPILETHSSTATRWLHDEFPAP